MQGTNQSDKANTVVSRFLFRRNTKRPYLSMTETRSTRCRLPRPTLMADQKRSPLWKKTVAVQVGVDHIRTAHAPPKEALLVSLAALYAGGER